MNRRQRRDRARKRTNIWREHLLISHTRETAVAHTLDDIRELEHEGLGPCTFIWIAYEGGTLNAAVRAREILETTASVSRMAKERGLTREDAKDYVLTILKASEHLKRPTSDAVIWTVAWLLCHGEAAPFIRQVAHQGGFRMGYRIFHESGSEYRWRLVVGLHDVDPEPYTRTPDTRTREA